ncbi:MAG: hypothetical protein OXI67_16230 [Candidatus Poribacteria bacterium]|nr:hypothetical protein [Candidatus Poribacteria bacterium]
MLTCFTVSTLVNREQVAPDAGTLLGEDVSPVRCGAIPQVMAALRNTALSVFGFAGITRIADKMKYLASKPKLAVNMIK